MITRQTWLYPIEIPKDVAFHLIPAVHNHLSEPDSGWYFGFGGVK